MKYRYADASAFSIGTYAYDLTEILEKRQIEAIFFINFYVKMKIN